MRRRVVVGGGGATGIAAFIAAVRHRAAERDRSSAVGFLEGTAGTDPGQTGGADVEAAAPAEAGQEA
ncbi:hypothetical protein AB0I00_04420 [Streptomyces sp. NPDC050803]|uniref:hypothetical protein n=1 Tax=unclassified Streptomyces TaxID=2593676 RepID=UPI003444E31C